jgi:predicted lipid-binding transport protein (Tim44 family)
MDAVVTATISSIRILAAHPVASNIPIGRLERSLVMTESLNLNAYIPYLLIAASYVIILRLWLSTPPADERKEASGEKATSGSDREMPAVALQHVSAPLAKTTREPGQMPEALPLSETLACIRAADGSFDEKAFLSGASQAYELVVNAFAKGDTVTLNVLLDTEAANTLNGAIQERQEKADSLTLTLIGIRKLDITGASLEADLAEVAVRFVSELITVTRTADNTVTGGDPERIVVLTDLWTFARRIPSRDPNWKIVATGGT